MSNLSHLWQRFLLASSLLVGLAIGVATTVFGYSNLGTVDVHWSVLRLTGVPLWTVAVIPVALILIAGTVYHWIDGLHHFTEHMRHRHRVHELESEVTRLKAHLDQVLEMPRGEMAPPAIEANKAEVAVIAALPAAPEPESEEAAKPTSKRGSAKRPKITLDTEPAAAEAHTNGAEKAAALSAPQEV